MTATTRLYDLSLKVSLYAQTLTAEIYKVCELPSTHINVYNVCELTSTRLRTDQSRFRNDRWPNDRWRNDSLAKRPTLGTFR